MSFFKRLFGGERKAARRPTADPIDAFWEWWAGASESLAETINAKQPLDEDQVEAVSEHVHAIHESLAWEMGPGENSAHHFALTSEGDAELRVIAERWLARAPRSCKTWEYYAARQASSRAAENQLSLNGRVFAFADFRVGVELDTDHAVAHVVAYHPGFADLAEDERNLPTFLFLDDTLGEDAVTSWIGSVDSSAEEPSGAVTAQGLRDAIGTLKEQCDEGTLSFVKGSVDGAPLMAVMCLQLKRLNHLFYDHHWLLTLSVEEADERGFPYATENEELNEFEDKLLEALGPRAVWIGHETYAQKRVIHFHADSSSISQDEVLQLCSVEGHWPAELEVTHDPSWEILHRY